MFTRTITIDKEIQVEALSRNAYFYESYFENFAKYHLRKRKKEIVVEHVSLTKTFCSS